MIVGVDVGVGCVVLIIVIVVVSNLLHLLVKHRRTSPAPGSDATTTT